MYKVELRSLLFRAAAGAARRLGAPTSGVAGRRDLGPGRRLRGQQAGQFDPVGGTQSAARVPTRVRIIADVVEMFVAAAVVVLGDVVKRTGTRRQGIDLRVYESDPTAELLVYARYQSGPQRSHGAGATDRKVFAIDQHVVAAGRIAVSGYVGNPAAFVSRFTERRRNAG